MITPAWLPILDVDLQTCIDQLTVSDTDLQNIIDALDDVLEVSDAYKKTLS
ncbi:hypothetical protein OAC48_07420 [Porticoccaceae bacterium]|nr:hypothetical protein [Porticoccaceae bacterium]